jgi:leader peptidase (prepilin peptidase)/N-methyltransferase
MNLPLILGCAAAGLAAGAAVAPVAEWAAWPDEVRASRWVPIPVTGALFALVAWRAGVTPALPAFLYLAAAGVVLAVVDPALHRLPDRIVLPSYPIAGGLLAAGALPGGDVRPLARAGLGALALFAAYYLLAVAGGVGFGDVKLAGVLGLVLGWSGWPQVVLGAALAFVYGGLCSAMLLLARRVGRKSRVPYGPFMLAGALTAVVLGQAAAVTPLA